MVSLADKVFEQLEQDILSGNYTAGEVLTEAKLSNALGVSRTPVREAVRRLEQAGLLQESGKGMIVVGISQTDLEDIYEIRRRLEGLAAFRASESKDTQFLEKLQEIVELQEFYTGKGDAGNIQALDSRFHKAIYEGCGGILRDTLSSLHRRIQRYRKDSVTDLDRARQAVAEHRAIYEAIAKGDSELAQELAVVHVCNACESIMKKQSSSTK